MTTAMRGAISLGLTLFFGLVIASGVSAGPIYNFENSNTGQIPVWNFGAAPGWDGWYTPPTNLVQGSGPATVMPYTVLPSGDADPRGGDRFLALALQASTPGTSTVRAQHDFDFSQATEWSVTNDLGVVNLSSSGNSIGVNYIGRFSALSTSFSSAYYQVLYGWDTGAFDSTWSSLYAVYDANGNSLTLLPASAWSGLLQEHWYSETTIFDEPTNRILLVSITDLTTNSATTVLPTDWYMYGGAGGHFSGNAIRFSGSGANNGLLVDNVELDPVPEPATLALMGTGVGALIGVRRRRTRVR